QPNRNNRWLTPSGTADFFDFCSGGPGANVFTIHTSSLPYWPGTISGTPCLILGGPNPTFIDLLCPTIPDEEDPDPDPEFELLMSQNDLDLLENLRNDINFYESN